MSTQPTVNKIQIRHWISGTLIHEGEGTLKEVLEAAVAGGANLRGAYLRGANLDGANLRGANLGGAYLDGAYLGGAYLHGAYLDGAYLDGAYLDGANLDGANLGGANLGGAYLGGANLDGANLDGANLGGANLGGALTLPEGITWDTYMAEVLPALLTVGGKSLESFRATGAIACHDWNNCLMAHAFGVHSLSDIPALYRPWAERTLQLFDARLLDEVLEKLIPGGEPETAEVAS